MKLFVRYVTTVFLYVVYSVVLLGFFFSGDIPKLSNIIVDYFINKYGANKVGTTFLILIVVISFHVLMSEYYKRKDKNLK